MPLDVLVCDDYGDTLDLLLPVLERWGHSYSVARSAADARAMATTQRFDVLLCNYLLCDGTCCGVVEAILLFYPIHGVAITGHGDDTYREKAIAAGFADYLTKPVSLPLLKEILDAVEARRKPAS
jgi:CheY-like chemotaxis protein